MNFRKLKGAIKGLCIKTRMTTFIKTKFNKSDDQTDIDNIEYCKYYRISK